MKVYFPSRSKARAVAKAGGNKVVDAKGNESPNGNRWAVELKR